MVGIGMVVWPAVALAVDESASQRAEWLEKEYRYVVIEQDVRDVLTEFGRNLSLPMDISSEVEGRVRGDIPSGSAGEFLDRVAAANGLVWYFDGSVIHVATRGEITQRTFDLRGIDSTRLMKSLDRRVGEPLSAQLVDDGSALQVVGPPAWIDSVARRVDRLRQPAASGYAGVTVFRGSVATNTQATE